MNRFKRIFHKGMKSGEDAGPLETAIVCFISILCVLIISAGMAVGAGAWMALEGEYWESIKKEFFIIFPVMCMAFIFYNIEEIFRIGRVKHRLFSIIVSLMFCGAVGFCAWFMGGKQSVSRFGDWSVSKAENFNAWGNKYYAINTERAYKIAKHNYIIAAWMEKYLDINDQSEQLPIYYINAARACVMLSEYDTSAKYYEKAIEAYNESDVFAAEEIAFAKFSAALAEAVVENYAREETYLSESCAYYAALDDQELNIVGGNAGRAYIAYGMYYRAFNQDAEAVKYLEKGIPLFYDHIDWGVGDDTSALLLLISYKSLADSAGNIENDILAEEYQKKYNDLMDLRDIDEQQMQELRDMYHWK